MLSDLLELYGRCATEYPSMSARVEVAGYQDAIDHPATTIDPRGCAPTRRDHSVDVISQTSMRGRARHLTGPSARHRRMHGSWPNVTPAQGPGVSWVGVQAAKDDEANLNGDHRDPA